MKKAIERYSPYRDAVAAEDWPQAIGYLLQGRSRNYEGTDRADWLVARQMGRRAFDAYLLERYGLRRLRWS